MSETVGTLQMKQNTNSMRFGLLAAVTNSRKSHCASMERETVVTNSSVASRACPSHAQSSQTDTYIREVGTSSPQIPFSKGR